VAHLVDFKLCDYRSLTGPHHAGTSLVRADTGYGYIGQFDKILSIEMMEALGHEYLGTFYQACQRLLKPEGLLAVQVRDW
jgi:cyclopropane fatty-acyl-phospholipid synthase-like methyltransferase